jgi:hypothetical protein
MLKSGGQAMTVVSASGDDVECIWIGEEGEFFRQAIPAVALEAIDAEDEDEDAEGDEAEAEDEVEEEDEKPKGKRTAA